MALVATSPPPPPIDRSIGTSSASMFAPGRPPPSPTYSSPSRASFALSLNGIKKPTRDEEEAAFPVTPTSPSAHSNMPSQPDPTTSSRIKDGISSLLTRGNASEGANASVRPAKDVAAFNSLLPPPVEFVEGSSNGSFLQSLEGKYEPINGSPKASAPQLEEDETKGNLKLKQRDDDATSRQPKTSLYTTPIDLTWPKGLNHGSGLYNTGNTCFLNSALQCLLHTPPLLRILGMHPRECRSKDRFCMSCAMKQTMDDSFTKGKPFLPSQVLRNLQLIGKHFRKGRQEDTHEFLRFAIDAMQKSCLAGFPPKLDHKIAETTWVHKLFGGRLRSRVSCQSCGYNSDTFDSVLDLSIDIYNMPGLKDALRKYTAIDYLRGADKYKCEKCKKPVNAEKRFTIHEAPPVLTVHLKRFTPLGRKLQHPVRYDEQLSLAPYMSDGQHGPMYSLYGVISHMGSGPNHGHYFAHVRGADGTWYEMNDEFVDSSKRPLNMKNAYVLFYIREKGQALQAAVNGYSSVNGTAKRRRTMDGDEDIDMKSPQKNHSEPLRLIGPVIPPHLRTPSANPQQVMLAKKIEVVEKAKTQAPEKPKTLNIHRTTPRIMVPLVDYDGGSDEEKGEPVERSDAPSSNAAIASTSSPPVTSSMPESDASPERPHPPPTSSPPLTSPAPIDPSTFYGTSTKSKSTKRKSSEPASDDDDDDDEPADNISSISTYGGGMQWKGKSSSANISSTSASILGSVPNTTKRHSLASGGNPYGRARISDNLYSDRDEEQQKKTEQRELFRKRKTVRGTYGGGRRTYRM